VRDARGGQGVPGEAGAHVDGVVGHGGVGGDGGLGAVGAVGVEAAEVPAADAQVGEEQVGLVLAVGDVDLARLAARVGHLDGRDDGS
jgi:hypothetical protein